MCFSAPVSFAASVGLAAIGGASVNEARKLPDKRQLLVAIIPLLFSVQQALEGWQWLALRDGTMSPVAGYGFLFFAFLIWPVYVPVGVYILDVQTRKYTRWFVAIGLVVSFALFVILITKPLTVIDMNHSLAYYYPVPPQRFLIFMYVLALCGSLLASKIRAFRQFGLILFVSAAVAALVFYATFVSVWCFFAALISSFAYVYLRKKSIPREINS